MDFIVFLSALFISSSIVTSEKKSFKETVKKATYTSFFGLLIVTLCKIAIPWSSLLLGIILVLAFGYGVYHFYDGGVAFYLRIGASSSLYLHTGRSFRFSSYKRGALIKLTFRKNCYFA